MKAKLSKTIYRVDQDTADSSDEQSYDIGPIERSNVGNLEVILDVNPIENRLYCYTHSGKWWASSYSGRNVDIDPIILECLNDIEAAINEAIAS